MSLNNTETGQVTVLLLASIGGLLGGATLCGSLVAHSGRRATGHVLFWLALGDMGYAFAYLITAVLLFPSMDR